MNSNLVLSNTKYLEEVPRGAVGNMMDSDIMLYNHIKLYVYIYMRKHNQQ